MSFLQPQCCECGRFMRLVAGCAWKMCYSGGPVPEPDEEIFKCLPCTEKHGPFHPQDGIVARFSCGIVTAEACNGSGVELKQP